MSEESAKYKIIKNAAKLEGKTKKLFSFGKVK
jgi:hypothetical protein